MSYENVPKNLTEQAILVRGGRPDYLKLEVAAFPTPTVDEIGAILENTDTGDRFRWTSTAWVQVGEHGATYTSEINIAKVLVNQNLHGTTVTSTTLAVAVASGDHIIDVASSAGMLVGDRVKVNGTSLESSFPKIIGIAANLVTLSRPLDQVHAIGGDVEIVPVNMNIVGTLATPILFSYSPDSTELVHITRLVFAMTHTTAGDMGLFGNVASLANGVVLRAYRAGVYRTFTRWENCGDMAGDMFEVVFDARASGGGTYGTTARLILKALDSVIQLDGSLGDKIELLIQDDLSGLTTFTSKAQGHIL